MVRATSSGTPGMANSQVTSRYVQALILDVLEPLTRIGQNDLMDSSGNINALGKQYIGA